MFMRRSSSFGRPSKDMTDPYTLLLEGRLDSLRPNLECLSFNDPYSYPRLDKDIFLHLRKDFEGGTSLQLISQRSRPGAFLSPDNLDDPNNSGPGVVEIKVVKAGFLSRTEGKRKVWKEWGIILTASQLYFFKDTSWFKNNIMNQQNSLLESRKKDTISTVDGDRSEDDDEEAAPVIIRPMIDGFHPHAVVPTTEIAALFSNIDEPRKKNCFLLAYKSGNTEWFSSHDPSSMNDWGLKINFAASFNTFYVTGVPETIPMKHPKKLRTLRRTESISSTSTAYSGATSIISKADLKRKQYSEIHLARKFNVEHKLQDINRKLTDIQESLNEHMRTGEHLKLLAPIQIKSREAVFSHAATLTATLRWKWLERMKLLCYKDYFDKDLEVESEICAQFKPTTAAVTPVLTATANPSSTPQVPLVSEESVGSCAASIATAGTTAGTSTTGTVTAGTVTADAAVGIAVGTPPTVREDFGSPSSLKIPKRTGSAHSRSLSHSNGPPASAKPNGSHTRSKSQSLHYRRNSEDIKRMPLTLRDQDKRKPSSLNPNQQRNGENDNSVSTPQRSASLMRGSQKITLYGKNFRLVEVNPEFGSTSAHQRSLSQHLSKVEKHGLGIDKSGLNLKNQLNFSKPDEKNNKIDEPQDVPDDIDDSFRVGDEDQLLAVRSNEV